MKAYTVHKFYVCQITGEVNAQISFGITEDLETLEKPFPNVEFANAHIGKAKRDWFLFALEKFVNHKKQVIENSQPDANKQKALQVCLSVYNDFCVKGLDTIAKRFLAGKAYFETILPNNNNNSYNSSKENLNELIKFCETEAKINLT